LQSNSTTMKLMYRRLLIFSAKILIRLLRLTGTSGSALPGRIIERLYPNFLARVLKPVEKKIILITGTNGKTTTTKMLVEVLRGNGNRVVTNGTGSNMTRGLISALVEDMTYFGSLKATDWFIFEMDEAYVPIFTENLSPHITLGLNVLRDQLDRYGEIDTTAKYIASAAKKSDIFVFNQIDPLLNEVAKRLPSSVDTVSFGVAEKLFDRVTNEQTVHDTDVVSPSLAPDMLLRDSSDAGSRLWVTIESKSLGERWQMDVPLQGFHNAINVTAVVSVIQAMGQVNIGDIAQYLKKMQTPFGRGERLMVKNSYFTVALIKNPSGFTSNIRTFIQDSRPDVVLFVINDNLADGRDVSWLWDVTLRGMVPKGTELLTSGIRGADMALRLKQDGFEAEYIPDVNNAILRLTEAKAENITIIPTYTALFEVRSELSKYTKVPNIW
jgi:UDP-N-acetylmuramyl tripeptide synthase